MGFKEGLSMCGTQTLLPCSVWDLPGPGIESESPALAGESLTTGPPGKSIHAFTFLLSTFLYFYASDVSLMNSTLLEFF